MIFTKNILIGLLILSLNKVNSQSMSNMITSNIQTHLINNRWSSIQNSSKAVVFYFKERQLFVLVNNKELANSDYYFTETDCTTTSSFESLKIGSSSSGNYIKTKGRCYIIEFFKGYQKFRLKSMNDLKWQEYYILDD